MIMKILKAIGTVATVGAAACAGYSIYLKKKVNKIEREIQEKEDKKSMYLADGDEFAANNISASISVLHAKRRDYIYRINDACFYGMTFIAIGGIARACQGVILCNKWIRIAKARASLLDKQYLLSAKYIPDNDWMKFNGDLVSMYDKFGANSSMEFNPAGRSNVLMDGYLLRKSIYA